MCFGRQPRAAISKHMYLPVLAHFLVVPGDKNVLSVEWKGAMSNNGLRWLTAVCSIDLQDWPEHYVGLSTT